VSAADEILEDVRRFAPSIAARSDEISLGRRVPPDLVDDLTAAGCFRSLVPPTHGGAGLDLTAHLRVLEVLARADGSVGWTVMIGSAAPVILGLLPRPSFDEVYASGPDVALAGAFNPTGGATPQEDGFRVTGQWSYASGCQHAHWFIAHCVVDDGRLPPVRMMVLPASEVEIKDTWFVSGLSGTGSHDFAVNDVFVPEPRSFVLGGAPCLDGPVHRIPELSFSTLTMGAVAVGIAQGALDEALDLALDKVPAFEVSTLASRPLFQHELGAADAQLRAARSLLHAQAADAWAQASAGTPFTDEARARIRAGATWVVHAAAEVVDTAYTLGGGTSNNLSSPLQRRLRDARAVTQHFAVKPDTFTMAGAVLAGQEVDLTFL
jgi:alkylation response protein AidB-like acyl-CoA dehydrogenase